VVEVRRGPGSDEAKRLRAAFEMADEGVAMMRQNLRRRHPGHTEDDIDRLLREWLASKPPKAG
jgi:hypothetical protein